MDIEKLFVIHSVCESKVFDKLRILIAENVSEIYGLKITNTLNHTHYSLKFIIKTTSKKCTMICEILQEYEVIITNCYELAFPSYRVRITGELENCLSIHKQILNSFVCSGAIPIKSEVVSDDFVTAVCDVIVTNKDPSKCIKFIELMRENKNLSYKVIPVEHGDY